MCPAGAWKWLKKNASADHEESASPLDDCETVDPLEVSVTGCQWHVQFQGDGGDPQVVFRDWPSLGFLGDRSTGIVLGGGAVRVEDGDDLQQSRDFGLMLWGII